jgi:phosphoglycerate dehydrogenase-like enzyme
MLPPRNPETAGWPARLEAEVPGVRVLTPTDDSAAAAALLEADAAYGVLPAELLAYGTKMRWLQAPQAGPPPEFYHQALVDHPLVVTNMRDTYTDHVATHALAMILALARRLPTYVRDQQAHRWEPDRDPAAVLPMGEATALVIGVGAVGAEVGRMLAAFGTRVVGVDARITTSPPHFAELGSLDDLLPAADIVVLTVPHTPATEGMVNAELLRRFKPTALFVNIGRGPTVRLDDLTVALAADRLGAAALDVFETEPLPPEHPLWTRPDVLITPHVAGAGPHAGERRYAVLRDNLRRFVAGEPLLNQVDKAQRF